MTIPDFKLTFYRYKPSQTRRYMAYPLMKAYMHVQPRHIPLKTGEVYKAIKEYNGKGIKYEGEYYHLDLQVMNRDFRALRVRVPETSGTMTLIGKTISGEILLLKFEASENLRTEFFKDVVLDDGKIKKRFSWLVETMLEMQCAKVSFEYQAN